MCEIVFNCTGKDCHLFVKREEPCGACADKDKCEELCFKVGCLKCLISDTFCKYMLNGKCNSQVATVQQITKYLKSIGLNPKYDGGNDE